jgi:hypothetical protein
MSGSKAGDRSAGVDVGEAIARNPKVDGDQLREAQKVLSELKKSGVAPATYEIASPYQKPSRHRRAPRSGRHFT